MPPIIRDTSESRWLEYLHVASAVVWVSLQTWWTGFQREELREEDGEKEKGRDGWERNWWTLRDLYGPESHIMSLLQHSVGQSSYKVHLVLVGRNTDCTTQWWSITLLEGISNGMYIGTAICGQYTLCKKVRAQFSSVAQLCLTLWDPKHCSTPGFTPRVCLNSCPSSQWWHPTISFSVIPFSSHLQSFPASGSFPMSQFFASGSQSNGVSVSASVLPMNVQDWFPLGWTGLISLQSKGLSLVLGLVHSKCCQIIYFVYILSAQLSFPKG